MQQIAPTPTTSRPHSTARQPAGRPKVTRRALGSAKHLLATLFATLGLMLHGCGTAPTVPSRQEAPQEARNPDVARAESLHDSGDFNAAARLYEELAARTPPPLQHQYLLLAAENWMAAGNLEATGRLLKQIGRMTLSPEPAFRRNLLAAELAIHQNRGEEALDLLSAPPADYLPRTLRLRYHLARAEALRLTANALESARELSLADPLLSDDHDARLANQTAILQALSGLSEQVLELFQGPPPDDTFSGWLELARIGKANVQTPQALSKALEEWRLRFPSHPAMPELLEQYQQQATAHFIELNNLAVMLPRSGPYARAAAAVRDGLMAAYYAMPVEERPQLRFYDSSNPGQAWPLLQQAVEEGANVVIGPLDKRAVDQLAHAGEVPVPVLALNRVPLDTNPPTDLYQFALAPEDEAAQIADRAWGDGHATALIFTPTGSWGDRVRESFRQRWENIGGVVVGEGGYPPQENDFSVPIRKLLHLDQSRWRHRQLERLLGEKIGFEPRRRQDADILVLAAKAGKARELWPQFQFFRAGDLPTYTTSRVFSGEPDPKRDIDLEGLRFPDIPWILDKEDHGPLSRQALRTQFPGVMGRYSRLYAMGIDAFNLLPHLLRLRGDPAETYQGATGHLTMDEVHRIHRQLLWARFQNGIPKVLGFTPYIETAIQSEQNPALIENAAPLSPADRPAADDGVR